MSEAEEALEAAWAAERYDDNLTVESMKLTVEKLKTENAMREEAVKSLSEYSKAVSLASKPSNIFKNDFYDQLIYSQLVTGAGTGTWLPDAPQIRVEIDKKLQLKLFIHFAKLFCEKFPKWQLVPEPEDPFGKVKLVRPDIGATIVSLYPDNQVAVYGGPDIWTNQYRELGTVIPIAKVVTQHFFGWALDIDTPEWVR